MKLKNKKTIAFFNGFYIPHLGGVERYTSKLVEELSQYYNIMIITTNDSNLSSYEIIDNIHIYRLPTYKIFKNRFPILKKNKEYKKLIEKIISNKIDHIICNTRYYQTSILGAKLAKKYNIDLSVIDHSSNHLSVGNKIFDRLGAHYEHYITNVIKSCSPRFYGVSLKSNEWLRHFNINASGVFYNSIDGKIYNEFYKPVKNKKIVLSYIGRIIKEKGVINLLDCYAKLLNKYDNIELFVAGDGPILDELKTKYDNVKFLGKIDYKKVLELCVKTDIFVHPSMYPEGLPTSILEAGIMKTAVVATDRGGTREVISNDNIGLIVEENVEDLYSKIEYLLNNKKEIEKLKNGIHDKIIKNFTWKETAKKVMEELKKYE